MPACPRARGSALVPARAGGERSEAAVGLRVRPNRLQPAVPMGWLLLIHPGTHRFHLRVPSNSPVATLSALLTAMHEVRLRGHQNTEPSTALRRLPPALPRRAAGITPTLPPSPQPRTFCTPPHRPFPATPCSVAFGFQLNATAGL